MCTPGCGLRLHTVGQMPSGLSHRRRISRIERVSAAPKLFEPDPNDQPRSVEKAGPQPDVGHRFPHHLKSPMIPNGPYTYLASLPEGMKADIRAAFFAAPVKAKEVFDLLSDGNNCRGSRSRIPPMTRWSG